MDYREIKFIIQRVSEAEQFQRAYPKPICALFPYTEGIQPLCTESSLSKDALNHNNNLQWRAYSFHAIHVHGLSISRLRRSGVEPHTHFVSTVP